jgi:ABC-type Na+ efflux pump permease subunit
MSPTTINNTLNSTADVVSLDKVRSSSDKNNKSTGKETPRSTGKPITLPEDIVTLSPEIRGEGAEPAKKKPSVAVSADERQALLKSVTTSKGFSVYG